VVQSATFWRRPSRLASGPRVREIARSRPVLYAAWPARLSAPLPNAPLRPLHAVASSEIDERSRRVRPPQGPKGPSRTEPTCSTAYPIPMDALLRSDRWRRDTANNGVLPTNRRPSYALQAVRVRQAGRRARSLASQRCSPTPASQTFREAFRRTYPVRVSRCSFAVPLTARTQCNLVSSMASRRRRAARICRRV